MARRKKISFSLPLAFGEDSKVAVEKAYSKETTWEELTGRDLAHFTIKNLIEAKARVVLQGIIDGAGEPLKFWLCTYDEDYEQIKAKHKGDLVLHIGQVFRSLEANFLSVLLPAGIFDGTVVSVKASGKKWHGRIGRAS